MNEARELVIQLLAADSIGAIVTRALIWLGLVSIFAIGAVRGKETVQVKAEAGFFLGFIVITGVLIAVVFRFIPTLSIPTSALPIILT